MLYSASKTDSDCWIFQIILLSVKMTWHNQSSYGNVLWSLLVSGFFFLSLFIYFWDRVKAHVEEGQRERERERESQAGFAMSAQSPMRVSNSQTVSSWPEPKPSRMLNQLNHPDTPYSVVLDNFIDPLRTQVKYSWGWRDFGKAQMITSLYSPRYILLQLCILQ